MLCYVMLCYVMLCYVMLCYVMLCYVMVRDRRSEPCLLAELQRTKRAGGAPWVIKSGNLSMQKNLASA